MDDGGEISYFAKTDKHDNFECRALGLLDRTEEKRVGRKIDTDQ